VIAKVPEVDVLVNNVAIFAIAPFSEFPTRIGIAFLR
jgi:NAD(P)-dependent dehydrogenase (short-subunit alcohol dehydrogenase family)